MVGSHAVCGGYASSAMATIRSARVKSPQLAPGAAHNAGCDSGQKRCVFDASMTNHRKSEGVPCVELRLSIAIVALSEIPPWLGENAKQRVLGAVRSLPLSGK